MKNHSSLAVQRILHTPRRCIGMLLALLLVTLLGTPRAMAADAPGAPAAKPNVVYIITDDVGYNDFGFQGCKDIQTPNIDALSKQSVRFTNAYVSAPVCGASRVGIITGRYQERHSFEDTPLGNAGVAVSEATIADALKAGGYVSAMIGKWSMGTADQFHPMRRGFDECFGFLGMLHPYVPGPVTPGLEMVMSESPRLGFGVDPPARGPRGGGLIGGTGPGSSAGKFLRGFAEVDEPEYATEAFTREAVSFLRRHRDEPFFLYLAYNASHSPLQPTKKYLDRYPNLTGKRQLYAATTSALDDGVGEVIATLRELKLEDNTLIVFVNDNGGAVDDIAADNAPLNGAKFQLWEGGIRVPMFVRWKGRVAEGKVVDQPIITLDLFPTVLAATHLPAPPGKELDGINLLPMLATGTDDAAQMDRVLYWRVNALTAIRKGKWKLTKPQPNVTSPLLFDLSSDVGENKNLANENPQVVKELSDLWDKWNEKNLPVGRGGGGARRGVPAAPARGGPARGGPARGGPARGGPAPGGGN